LFFQNLTDEDLDNASNNKDLPTPSTAKSSQRCRRPVISNQSKLALRSSNITFPFEIGWETYGDNDDDTDDNNDARTDKDEDAEQQIFLRLMTPSDLDDIIPMCIEEFGTGPTTRLRDFPGLQSFLITTGLKTSSTMTPNAMFPAPASLTSQIASWWDRLWLEPFIRWALTSKMLSSGNHKRSSVNRTDVQLSDPVLLVLCQRRRRPEPKSIFKKKRKDGRSSEDELKVESHPLEENIVGMVEISLQPIEYDKNPPAFPVPRWIKEQYSRINDLGPLEGWVTNLLVPPTARGRGYSKILMWATEGIAKKWNCHSIYLHADADIRSGRIPQRLYEGLGYKVVHGNPMTFRAFQQKYRRQRYGQNRPASPSVSTAASKYNDDYDDMFAWAADASRSAGLSPFSSSIRMVQGAALLCYRKNLVNIDQDDYYSL
jgi:GNAT superfamily N-acetyltransferase